MLSNVVVGRNDDYGGDYLGRLAASLNHLAWNLEQDGRQGDVEVLYVDWGSEKTHVADVLQLGATAAAMVRFVEVDARLVRELSEPANFYATLAVNVGVRRAAGEYVMLTDSDCLMRRIALSHLLQLLEGELDPVFDATKHIFPLRRIQIPYDIVRRNPSPETWDTLLESLQPGARTESPGTGCLGGFSAGQLMHRKLWYEFGGYNERLKRSWGWSDNELMLRVTRKYGWADLAAYGIMAFHMEHGPRRRWWYPADLPQREPNRINAMILGDELFPNRSDWGLRDHALPMRSVATSPSSTTGPPGRRVQPLQHNLLDRTAFDALMATPEVQQAVRRVVSHCKQRFGVTPQKEEKRCIAVLAGFVSSASPLNLFYYGDLVESLLLTILSEHTAIQAYFIRPWLEGDTGSQPCNPAVLSQVLEQSMYRGYARIMTGDPATALDTLASVDGIELALVNTSRREAEGGAMTENIAGRLVPGGLAVIFGPHCGQEIERYDRVSSADVRAGTAGGGPCDIARKPYSSVLRRGDVLRVITICPDIVTLIARPPQPADQRAGHAEQQPYDDVLRTLYASRWSRAYRRIISTTCHAIIPEFARTKISPEQKAKLRRLLGIS